MDIKALVARNQVTNESNERMISSIEAEDRSKADWLWERMTGIWGEQWARENGSSPSQDWITNLSSITEQHLERGVKRNLSERLTWPPTLPKFLSLCLDFDTTDAFNRMINHKPVLDDVEYYTRQDCGYRCKRVLDDAKARALYNKTFIAKLELKRKGKLPIRDQKLLSNESTVTELDKEISNRCNNSSERSKSSLENRMNRIIKNRVK
jgi:hypothetical protein